MQFPNWVLREVRGSIRIEPDRYLAAMRVPARNELIRIIVASFESRESLRVREDGTSRCWGRLLSNFSSLSIDLSGLQSLSFGYSLLYLRSIVIVCYDATNLPRYSVRSLESYNFCFIVPG